MSLKVVSFGYNDNNNIFYLILTLAATMAQQQPVFVSTQSPVASVAQPQRVSGGYKAAAAKITGAFQIVCGEVSIVAGICAVVFGRRYYEFAFNIAGWPIWGGVVSIIIVIEIEKYIQSVCIKNWYWDSDKCSSAYMYGNFKELINSHKHL